MNTGWVNGDDARTVRGIGWVSLPVLGMFGVAVAAVATKLGGDRLWANVVLTVVPDLSQGGAVYSRPWSSQLAVFGGITCAAALAAQANLILRAVDERHPGRRFCWLWASTLVAALIVTGAVALGQVLGVAAEGHPTPATLGGAAGQAAAAVRWWLLPGAAAAAITTGLAPRRPRAQQGAVLYLRVAIAGGLGLATALAAGQLVAVAAGASASSAKFGHPSAGTPVPAATPTPSADPSDPALRTNPVPTKGFPGRCKAGLVTVSYRFTDAAAGTRFGLLTVRNAGASTCVLNGYPDLAFADEEGNNVRVRFAHGRWDGVTSEKPRPVRLQPGGSARAELRWHGDAGAYDREVPTILVAPWAGATRTELSDRFDVKNGSVVTVSPWLPTA